MEKIRQRDEVQYIIDSTNISEDNTGSVEGEDLHASDKGYQLAQECRQMQVVLRDENRRDL